MGIAGIALAFSACMSKTDKDVHKKLDEINTNTSETKKSIATLEGKLGVLEAKLSKVEGALRKGGNPAARRRPGRPNAQVTYAVPIGSSATVGPKNAPITIIEGFEFL